jgi:TetR/AcrR family transcriptional repressor of nem operon
LVLTVQRTEALKETKVPRPASDKLDRLTAAASTLAYTRGFDRTTIGDIAAEAGVAPGSIYYYFKTKDDVGRAIVDSMLVRYQQMLGEWEGSADPRERLANYVGSNLRDAQMLREYGCPIGSLCTQLRKQSDDLGDYAAGIFRMTIAWASDQFEALGLSSATAHDHAVHLLIRIQGAASLSNTLDSVEPLESESLRLLDWVAAVKP